MSARRVVLVCCVVIAVGAVGVVLFLRWSSHHSTGSDATAAREEPLVLSAAELLAGFTDRPSAFFLDVTVDRFDGGTYQPGETYSVNGTAERDGFLYLFRTDPDGSTRLIFPLPGQENRVPCERRFRVPSEAGKGAFAVPTTEGTYRVKAVVTRTPVHVSSAALVIPAQPAADRGGLQGRAFAWDEVLFHVEAAGGSGKAPDK
jgi:hypothetical protein